MNSLLMVTGARTQGLILTCVLMAAGLHAVNADTLIRVDDFGDNPGEIGMYIHVPDNIPARAPLVVSLHGCRQDVATYADAGWNALADEWKFYVLYPEQSIGNNPYACWNWFAAADTQRGEGEAASIMAMIETMRERYDIDENRIFVEGLSAGAYMTAVLLAAYPDVFAGGATHAGGPAYCAVTERHFWDPFGWWYSYTGNLNAGRCMRGLNLSPEDWGERVRQHAPDGYNGPWPIISIWHGNADDRVKPGNLDELVDQWTYIHGIDRIFDDYVALGPEGRFMHSEYQDDHGIVRVETWQIDGMSHGTAIAGEPGARCGRTQDYILDAGICAPRRIGRFWGLDD